MTSQTLATHYPWRALQVHNGALHLEPDGAAANVFDGASMELPVTLVDEGTHGARSRLHVLCDNPSSRVALYLDQTDVAPVAANGTVMVTSSSVPATVQPTTPAFHIHPGTPLEAGASGPRGTRFITVKGLLFHAQGYVRASKVGFAWREETPADEQTDLEIPNGATFLDAPGGRVLATLEAYPNPERVHAATRLGAQDSGHVLVRFSNDLGVLVGWVRMEQVRSSTPVAWGYGKGEGGLTPKGPVQPRLQLACGTTLVDGQGRPVGVTTADDSFVCEGDCGARPARVWVPACNTRLLVTVAVQHVRPCKAGQ